MPCSPDNCRENVHITNVENGWCSQSRNTEIQTPFIILIFQMFELPFSERGWSFLHSHSLQLNICRSFFLVAFLHAMRNSSACMFVCVSILVIWQTTRKKGPFLWFFFVFVYVSCVVTVVICLPSTSTYFQVSNKNCAEFKGKPFWNEYVVTLRRIR